MSEGERGERGSVLDFRDYGIEDIFAFEGTGLVKALLEKGIESHVLFASWFRIPSEVLGFVRAIGKNEWKAVQRGVWTIHECFIVPREEIFPVAVVDLLKDPDYDHVVWLPKQDLYGCSLLRLHPNFGFDCPAVILDMAEMVPEDRKKSVAGIQDITSRLLSAKPISGNERWLSLSESQ